MTKPDHLVSLYYPPPFLMLGLWLFLDHERFNEINVFYKIKYTFTGGSCCMCMLRK